MYVTTRLRVFMFTQEDEEREEREEEHRGRMKKEHKKNIEVREHDGRCFGSPYHRSSEVVPV